MTVRAVKNASCKGDYTDRLIHYPWPSDYIFDVTIQISCACTEELGVKFSTCTLRCSLGFDPDGSDVVPFPGIKIKQCRMTGMK